jgi:hypothetical protein
LTIVSKRIFTETMNSIAFGKGDSEYTLFLLISG